MARKFGKRASRKDAQRKGLGHKEAQFLHVREFSRGKPNEFSLNVLEQKAAAQEDTQKQRKHFWQRFHSSKAASSEASGTPSTVTLDTLESSNESVSRETSSSEPFLGTDAQSEIERRQKNRRRYRRVSIAVVIVVCLCGLGFGARWAYDQYEHWNTSVGVLQEACSLIEESDDVTLAIDEYFQKGFDDDTVSAATELLDKIPEAQEKLESARVLALHARDELDAVQHDREAAEAALNAIEARETLLELSSERLADDKAAKQAMDALDQAWQEMQEGNSLLARAAQVVSQTTNENVDKSTEYTQAAQENFTKAQEYIGKAAKLYSEADLDEPESYVEKRLEAISEALASNEAILIQDKATAEAHNEAYNQADSQAVEIAGHFPDPFNSYIVDAYAEHAEPLEEDYDQARADAATNDSVLRDYLGVTTNEASS